MSIEETEAASLSLAQAPYRVVIANYSGYIIGDDAIFEALMARVRRALGANVIIDALTAMPERTRGRYPIAEVDHIYEYSRSPASRQRVRKMLARANLLLIGGGDIIEGQQAFFVLTALARLVGTPIAYVGVGVLMPSEQRRRRMLAWSANQTRYIATRDAASALLLRKVNVHQPVIETLPDLAVGLLAQPKEVGQRILLENLGASVERPYVVVNIRAPEPWQDADVWGETYYEALVETCRALIDERNWHIVCVPLVSSVTAPPDAGPGDDLLMDTFEERIDRPGHVTILRGDYWPSEIAAALAGAQLAVGMRLHFLLLSAGVGVPAIALSYARKVEAFMQGAGMSAYCLEIEQTGAASLRERVDSALAEREDIRRQLIEWRRESLLRLETLEEKLAALVGEDLRKKRRGRHRGRRLLASGLLRAISVYGTVREALG